MRYRYASFIFQVGFFSYWQRYSSSKPCFKRLRDCPAAIASSVHRIHTELANAMWSRWLRTRGAHLIRFESLSRQVRLRLCLRTFGCRVRGSSAGVMISDWQGKPLRLGWPCGAETAQVMRGFGAMQDGLCAEVSCDPNFFFLYLPTAFPTHGCFDST